MAQDGFGALPYMPLKEQWLSEHPLFLGGDARLLRAAVRMLMAAWRNAPVGSVSPSYASLAAVTGLDEREIAENYVALTHGWELRDERLYHVEMADLCLRLSERHGDVLDQIAEDAALAMQEPQGFELTASQAEPSKNKGKRALRPSWRPSADTLKDLAALGITDQRDVDYLVMVMRNWALSKGEKRANWDATLMNIATKEPQRNLPSKKDAGLPLVPAGASRFGALVSKGEAALNHNMNVFDAARQRHGGF